MLRALLADLLEIPDVRLSASRDERLPTLQLPVEVVTVRPEDDVWQCWQQAITAADAVWVVAPETGGVLERLSSMVLAAGKQLLGSSPMAVAITARKSATSCALLRHAVDVVPTWDATQLTAGHAGPWVAKPDDGAGCEDTCWFDDAGAMQAWLQQGQRLQTHVVQPCLPGVPASFSMLCRAGKAWLLSSNRQQIQLEQGVYSYHGSVLNALDAHREAFSRVAQQVAQAVPGLAGYVGVDVMVQGETVTVIEINPRLTTSYVGMRRATGCNPARLVLDMFYNAAFEMPPTLARNVVEISLNE